MKVAVVGASGYTGGELLRLLSQHPKAQVVAATSEQSVGKPVSALFPSLTGFYPLTLTSLDPKRLSDLADLIFVALPHTAAMEPVSQFIHNQKRVIDLSADYRLKDPRKHADWYGTAHTQTDLLKQAVYGLCEIHRDEIRNAALVANPGCYPTGAILGLAPLLKEGLVDLQSIQIDAKSGLSGAGRSPSQACHFPEAHEGLEAYNIGTHRHLTEIEQELSLLAREELRVLFVPHRIPINRGILSTISIKPSRAVDHRYLCDLYRGFYGTDGFIRVMDASLPNVRNVRGSNFCDIGLVVEDRTGRVVVVTAIDNLVKGASGQAVQNMNIMFGFEESLGLKQPGIFP
ncbi:MAG: N-acetyl-gamma-glutamyl-phosphate reductase [Nitrospirae bacterium]|nr:N-acetyl-gamma-glutamyl-phosphate reductase [Nitrospirota bacterium]